MAVSLKTLLRRAFVDVCRGYSVGQLKTGQTVYIRHLGHREHADYEEVQMGFEAEAKAQGAQTEKDRLEHLYSKGLWSKDKEKAIETQRDFIARLEDGRKTIAVPSVLRSHEEQIKREKENLIKQITERATVLRETVETYAERRLEDYYLVHNLFSDKELTILVFDPEEFDNLPDGDIESIHETYKQALEPCSDANLRKLAAQDFFVSYYTLATDNPQSFFGKPIYELTYYQVRLLNQARYMKAILDNTDTSRLAPEKRNDPDAIESLHITQKNMDALKAEGKAPTGLTSQDLSETGMKNQFSAVPPEGLSGLELIQWLRKNNRPRS